LDSDFVNDPRFEGTDSYILAAYVKFMEAAGARVIPLIVNEPEEVMMEKLSKINGVLFPGGANDYVSYGRKIINHLKEVNDAGQFYPAWGTCLGFENLLIWASDRGTDILESYNAHAISLTLDFVVDPETTRMFGPLGSDAYTYTTTPMTLNSHSYGVNPDSFTTDKALSEFYRLTSVSYEPSTGKPFGTSIEAYDYPFYGTQFHPEKVLDLFTDNSGINHSWESIHYNRYFAD